MTSFHVFHSLTATRVAVLAVLLASCTALAAGESDVLKPRRRLERPPETRFELSGVMGDYLRAVTRQWLLIAPEANPGMLEMFRDRDRQPLRALEPWAGEFAGKYLTGAVQVYRLTHDAQLRQSLEAFVRELCSLQDADGYLGPWPHDSRLTGKAPNVGKGTPGPTWDAWGHYHVMLGLLTWYDETHDEQALAAAARIGDLLCARFLGARQPRLVDIGSTEMNLAPVHSLCLLYRATRRPRYLALARQVAGEFAARDAAGHPLAGDYVEAALDGSGREYFQIPKPRWESLHALLALPELYEQTGDERDRLAFERWWWSIAKLDRHNNGGFSSDEQARGNPYHQGAIETCSTIAWIAMTTEMLKLTGNSIVADELELSTLNSALGMHSPTGRWATYNTPMDGVRKASAHDIVFQARAGTPELNCCSVNSPRGLGLLSEWAVLRDAQGLTLNWYGPGKTATQLADGRKVAWTVSTAYPRDGHVNIRLDEVPGGRFPLRFRIPAWSAKTEVKVNGTPLSAVRPGTYVGIDRAWKAGDRVDLTLDFALHYWVGERECAGKVSIYRGPLLLTYDRRFNSMDPADIPPLDAHGLTGKLTTWSGRFPPVVLLDFESKDGRVLRLCDFASAGNAGSPYRSWLRVERVKPVAFSQTNPLRSGRE
jgi:uncharacterized protein